MFTAMTNPQLTCQAFELDGRGLADQQRPRTWRTRAAAGRGPAAAADRPLQGGVSGQMRYMVGG